VIDQFTIEELAVSGEIDLPRLFVSPSLKATTH